MRSTDTLPPAGRPARPRRDHAGGVRGEEGGAARAACEPRTARGQYHGRDPVRTIEEPCSACRANSSSSNAFLIAIFLLVGFPVHEFAHAFVAYRLGDGTAKMFGRLTLNPIVHFDPVGGLLLVISAFSGDRPSLRLGQADAGQPDEPARPTQRRGRSSPLAGTRLEPGHGRRHGDRLPRSCVAERALGPARRRLRTCSSCSSSINIAAGGVQPDPGPAARRVGAPLPVRQPARPRGSCGPILAQYGMHPPARRGLRDRSSASARQRSSARSSMRSPSFSGGPLRPASSGPPRGPGWRRPSGPPSRPG